MNDEDLLRARALLRRDRGVSSSELARLSGVTVAKAQQMLHEQGVDDDEDDDDDGD